MHGAGHELRKPGDTLTQMEIGWGKPRAVALASWNVLNMLTVRLRGLCSALLFCVLSPLGMDNRGEKQRRRMVVLWGGGWASA